MAEVGLGLAPTFYPSEDPQFTGMTEVTTDTTDTTDCNDRPVAVGGIGNGAGQG